MSDFDLAMLREPVEGFRDVTKELTMEIYRLSKIALQP
jgi:hypothetical protein